VLIAPPFLPAMAAEGSAWQPLVMFLPIILIFYVLLILPAQRKQKRLRQMLANLKAGDKVVTTGGIYGTIVGLKEETVQLKVADQVRIEVARPAIAGLQPPSKEER